MKPPVSTAYHLGDAWVAPPYDEIFDAGRLRLPYAELARHLGWDPLDPPEVVAHRLGDRPLGDDTRVLPSPLILDHAGYRFEIQSGVEQRARALQQFFADVVLGEGKFLRGETELTASLLDEILASEGTSLQELRGWWTGQSVDAIRFVYGPDLVREPGGRWVVLEDNVGCVSGCADSFLALAAYTSAAGLHPDPSHRPDLVVAVGRWLDALQLTADESGVVALLSDGDAARWHGSARLEEDLRRERLVEELGVRVVDNAEFEQIYQGPGLGSRGLKAVVNIGVPSTATWSIWLDAFFGRLQVPLLNAPGTSVLGNKAFLPFVNDMVSFYLAEEALLDAPPTSLLRDGALPPDLERWVVKTAAGCHGAGVFILRSQAPERLDTIRGMIENSWPARAAVAQQRVEISRFSAGGSGASPSYLVEIRALAYVLGWQAVFSGEQCIARLTPESATHDTEGLVSQEPIVAPVLSAYEVRNGRLAFAGGSWRRLPVAQPDPEVEGTRA